MAVLLKWASALLVAMGVGASPSIRYIRFSRAGNGYIGMQEVQVYNTEGVNVALGCGVTAANSMYQGSLSWAVDGAYQYTNSNNDMLVQSTSNNWIEFDLGSALSNLATLNLYVDYTGWKNSDVNWYPGDTITFMNGGRTVVGTHTLPTSWAGTSPLYIVDLVTMAHGFSTSEYANAFRALPYADLSGTPFATSLGFHFSELACAWTCTLTPPCQGYTWSGFSALNYPCCEF